MYPIIHPGITRLTDEFRLSQIIHINDHMPPVKNIHININGQKMYSKNTIIDLFNESNIDYKNKTFMFDHYLLFDDFEKIKVNNFIFLESALRFKNYMQSWEISSKNNISKNLTFMSNKIREHRILCATLLSNLFDSAKLAYTYNGSDKKNIINSELLIDTDYLFDISKTLPDRWIIHDELAESRQTNPVIGRAYTNNHSGFADCLYNQIYKNSATSIITEPNFYEHGCMLTEKTLMSIYAGHFMIWPGGWKTAEVAEKIGIDVFNDIIDHSYQYIEHPGQRVVEAILRNLNFLKNMELQATLRNQNIDRFNSNLELVRNLDLLSEKINLLN
jgi:hypothetical protein